MVEIVEQFKQEWSQELIEEAIERAVRETGRTWRDRKLNPITTVHLFFLQILHGNDELREHFGTPTGQREGCGFPIASWLALVHFGSGLFQKVIASPLRHHDLSRVTQIHPELQSGDSVASSVGLRFMLRRLGVAFPLSEQGRHAQSDVFGAQWLAWIFPCQRFTRLLAETGA
jgi:hypothetical protein